MQRKTKLAVKSGESPAYTLTPTAKRSLGKIRNAELRSKLLDKEMHHGQTVDICCASLDEQRGKKAQPDPFELASIEQYLASQASIRRDLERELEKHLAVWDPEKRFGRGPDVWKHIRISTVAVRPRKIQTREDMAGLRTFMPKLTERMIDKMLALSDKAETQSRFELDLGADWGDDHGRLVDFRDGKLLSFSVDG
jgi:hypothetical protein